MPAETVPGRFALARDEEVQGDSGATYRIVNELGRGGNGIVYRAAALNTNETYLFTGLEPQERRGF